MNPRQRRGATAHAAGLAAEEQVARHYAGTGHRVVARRWRGAAGEIDVVAAKGADTVFVEVKRARTHDAAAARVTPRQARRLVAAAAEYMDGLPRGALSPVRFDVALVDAWGRIELRANALCDNG